MPVSLAVVVAARNAAAHLEECLSAVAGQDPEPDALVVVDDASSDATAAIARSWTDGVVTLPAPGGRAAAWNAGVRSTGTDVVAFLDAGRIASPGWTAALTAAFDRGADAVAGARPSTAGTNIAVRRTCFNEVGGFDLRIPTDEDDLLFRLRLAGHPVTHAPDARAPRRGRPTLGQHLRQCAIRGEMSELIRWKYRQLPLTGMRAWPAEPHHTAGLLELAGAAVARAASTRVRLGLVVGSRPFPERVRADDAMIERSIAPLPDGPALLIGGGDAASVDRVTRMLAALPGVAVAPAGLAPLALRHWDEDPPWAVRLVREARRAGWPLDVPQAARRLEMERPKTWGEAFLALHAVHGWSRGATRWILVAAGPAGRELRDRLPQVPFREVRAAEDAAAVAALAAEVADP